jgi:Protein of unknown function (DUF3667)
MHPTNCLNCNTSLQTGANYCPQCGQKAAIHRLRFHDLWHDAIHYFTHADKGIFHLLKELAVHPGRVAREYIEGKRTKYFKPFNFFLIVAGVVVFMTHTFYREDNARVRQMEKGAMYAKDPAVRKYLGEMVVRMKKVGEITGKYSNVFNMLATPLFSLIMWLFFIRGRYTYIEHLVANMYIIPFSLLLYGLLIVPLRSWLNINEWWVLGSYFIFETVYRCVAYYQFINKKGVLAAFKAMLPTLLTQLLWFFGTYYLIVTYIRTGFK